MNAPQTHLTTSYVCVCCFRTQKDDSPQSLYLIMSYDGTVSTEDEMRVVSTCKMDVHKFPFDTQECNLTIGSAVHSSEFQVRSVTSMFFFKGSHTPRLPHFLSPQKMKCNFLHSQTPLGPLSFPERWWRLRESGSSCSCPSVNPTSNSKIKFGNCSYTRYATHTKIIIQLI